MDEREWRFRDKSNWARGPWLDEPDKAQWTDSLTGLPCLLVRNPMGALCGYVGIAKGHPLHGKSYNAEIPTPPGLMEQEIGKRSPITLFSMAFRKETDTIRIDHVFDVHGSITFADRCQGDHEDGTPGICHVVEEGEDDDIWWYGFDCGHSGDLMPGYLHHLDGMFEGAEYRDVAYVKEECARFAKQLCDYAAASAG